MKILLCCQWFAPSVGGVQKVIREIAEELVVRGHRVTVATSYLENRNYRELNGVNIKAFKISGNAVIGMHGDLDEYRKYVLTENFDAILIYAAQQWAFDALMPILNRITARKIHVPCGYSCYYDPRYMDYYRQMPAALHEFDHLIYNASDYRDINFAHQHKLKNLTVIPNGANRQEFAYPPIPELRRHLGIAADDFLFLTIGTPPFFKGHIEVARAYSRLQLPFNSTLILDGQYAPLEISFLQPLKRRIGFFPDLCKRGLKNGLKKMVGKEFIPFGKFKKALHKIDRQAGKRYLITDQKREEIISTFFAADLFVFASHIEYSPLVLYEASASGLPFLSVPVGNAEEITRWTQGGVICPARKDPGGRTRVSIDRLAEEMTRLALDTERRRAIGKRGRSRWQVHYTWEKIIDQYEGVITGGAGKC